MGWYDTIYCCSPSGESTINWTHVAEALLQLSAVVRCGVDLLSAAAQDTTDLRHVLLATD